MSCRFQIFLSFSPLTCPVFLIALSPSLFLFLSLSLLSLTLSLTLSLYFSFSPFPPPLILATLFDNLFPLENHKIDLLTAHKIVSEHGAKLSVIHGSLWVNTLSLLKLDKAYVSVEGVEEKRKGKNSKKQQQPRTSQDTSEETKKVQNPGPPDELLIQNLLSNAQKQLS